MGQLVESGAPTGEVGDEVAERAAGLASQLVGVEHLGGGGNQRNADSAGEAVDLRHRLVAKAALGGVDDTLEGEVVGGLGNDAEIGQRIADFSPLVEAEAADDAVGRSEEPTSELQS